jgi:phage tail-like protein
MADVGYELSTNGGAPPPAHVRAAAPSTVSVRRHLRNGVPDIYRRDAASLRDDPPPFAMRFLHALEEVLDPIVATLDSLPAHLDVDLAPEHALAGLATWLGVDEVESLPAASRREAVRQAGALGRRRGTRGGLELALRLFFPAISLRIEDHGHVVVSTDVDAPAPPAAAALFDVYCDQPLPPELQMAVARCIEQWKPVHAHYKLRVRNESGRLETVEARAVADLDGLTAPELTPPFGPAGGDEEP